MRLRVSVYVRHRQWCVAAQAAAPPLTQGASTEAGIDAPECFSVTGSLKLLLNRLRGKTGHSKDAKRGRRKRVKNAADLICQEEQEERMLSSVTQRLARPVAQRAASCSPLENWCDSLGSSFIAVEGWRSLPDYFNPPFGKLDYFYVPKTNIHWDWFRWCWEEKAMALGSAACWGP